MTPAEQMREMAAKVADCCPDSHWGPTIAAAIRALPLPPELEPPIVAEMEAALQFYANAELYISFGGEGSSIECDGGTKARVALAAYREGRKP